MMSLEFTEAVTNLIHTSLRIGFKDWAYDIGTISHWAGRDWEFTIQTPNFVVILSADQLREIANKMDELKAGGR